MPDSVEVELARLGVRLDDVLRRLHNIEVKQEAARQAADAAERERQAERSRRTWQVGLAVLGPILAVIIPLMLRV